MGNANTPSQMTTTPNAKPVLEIEQFKADLMKDYYKTVANYFMGNKEKAQKFMSALVNAVQKTPALLECDRASLFAAAMNIAELELYPSNISGEAYLIPYNGKATFQLGYQGIITLLYRAGTESIRSNIIYENDVFDYEEGLEARLVHKPDVFGERGEAKGAYAVAVVNGEKMFKVMGKDAILKFKEFSQSKKSEYSPWNSDKDPELHMWRKTVIKQLSKNLPKNDSVQKGLALDNQDSIVSKQQAQLDAGGAAVGKAFHKAPPVGVAPKGETENDE